MENKNKIAIIILALFMMWAGSKITQIRTTTDEQICILEKEVDRQKDKRKELKQEIEDLKDKIEELKDELDSK